MQKLGIDLGGTKTEGIILDARNKEIFRQRISTEQEKATLTSWITSRTFMIIWSLQSGAAAILSESAPPEPFHR